MKPRFLFLSVVLASLVFGASAIAGERILFVAPHPDDEILGTGAEIWAAQRSLGHQVEDYRVVLMTCGDAYDTAMNLWVSSGAARDLNSDGRIDYLDLGIARHLESLAALASLGVPAKKVIFLGYPDGGLAELNRSGGPPYRAPLTGASSVPYWFAYHFGAPFTADSVLSDLEEIIEGFNPTLIYSTTPTDEHPDHSQTREFVSEAIRETGGNRRHLEYLVHWESHEPGWPGQSSVWSVPRGHIPADISVKLSDLGMDPKLKANAIGFYSTQTAVEGDYLLSFVKDSEVFWKSRKKLSDYLWPN